MLTIAKSRSHRYVLYALCLLTLAILSSMTFAAPSNKWRIEVSEGSNSDGTIIFRISPVNGEFTDISVDVKDKTPENFVAYKIRDALLSALDNSQYKIEVDDGEDILIKKGSGTPNFDLNLVSNSVKSVRINLDRE